MELERTISPSVGNKNLHGTNKSEGISIGIFFFYYYMEEGIDGHKESVICPFI